MMKTLIVKSPCRTVIKSVWTPVPNQILSVPMYNIPLLAIWMGLDTSRAVHAQMELYITMTGKRSKDKRDGKNITRLIQCLIHSSMYQTSQPHYANYQWYFIVNIYKKRKNMCVITHDGLKLIVEQMISHSLYKRRALHHYVFCDAR